MRVNDVMTKSVASCGPDTKLAAAVEILWSRDCGLLPIVDADQRVLGVVTDRDICVALGTQDRVPSQVKVKEITSGRVVDCKPEEDLRKALTRMAEAKVRRLLVTDAEGRAQGILSIDDVILHTETVETKKNLELSPAEVVNSLKSVCAPRRSPDKKWKLAIA
jgi:CBS domain-containing protein